MPSSSSSSSSISGGGGTDFIRKSHKFWVRRSDVTAVICRIVPHLPVYRFEAKPAAAAVSFAGAKPGSKLPAAGSTRAKEAPPSNIFSLITSVYFDTPDFHCFKTRYPDLGDCHFVSPV
jgi:SPX domain protein involved in polyphosphate accumulation